MDDKQKIELALKHLRDPFYFAELNEREREAVRLASRGFSVPRVIAPKMGVTPKSVYVFLKSAAWKIGKWLNRKVDQKEFTDLLLKIVEGVLEDG